MATTAAAIRDAMLTLVEALTPSLAAETKFERHREAMDFRTWAEQNPSASFRRFSIRYAGNASPTPVSNIDVEETSHTFEVVIAYPNSARLGHPVLLELDDVVDSDQTQVHAAIGPPGYASLTAPATVLHEETWSREVAGPVIFAVIRYRVEFYRATGAVSDVCQVIGSGGRVYKTGDVITGESSIRALYLTNGLAKVTHTTPSVPNAETLSHYLYIKDGDGEWQRWSSLQYGDWSFYVIGCTVPYDRATVVEATDDAVEVDFQVDAYSLTTYPGGGINARDEAGNLIYPSSSSTPRKHTSIKLVKSIRMQRGEPGYYVGWHSTPRIGPGDALIPAYNNVTTDYGEREMGLGPDVSVAWSSAGVTSYHPAWGSDARWAAAEAAVGAISNRVAWMGIDDPEGLYQPTYWANAAVIATQATGFPGNQSTGPYYVAALKLSTNVCAVLALREPLETGVWQYGQGQYGIVVCHHVNEFHSPAGVPYRHQLFIGGVAYTPDESSAFANEPTAGLRTTIATLAAGLDWPEN